MESKASIIGTLLLVLLLVTPCSVTSRGGLYVKNMDSQIYDIDYRGPETHRYRPSPNRAHGHYIAARENGKKKHG